MDKPAVAIATGPITGVGTETQTEDEYPDHQISYAVLHLPRGDVSITFAETFSWVPDFRACLAHGTGSGTFAITGGTGAYRGATGSGTFTDTGPLLGPRDQHGRWLGPDSGVLPRLVTVRVDAVGTTSTSG